MSGGNAECCHQKRNSMTGILWVTLMLLLLLQLVPLPAAAGDIRKNSEPYFYKVSSIQHPIVFPTRITTRESMKSQMLVGTCKEDRVVPMKRTTASTIPKSLPTPTPEEVAENTIEDMTMVMEKETKPNDPMMSVFKEMVKTINTTEDEITSRTSGGLGTMKKTMKDFENEVRQFLAVSGIDAVLPLECGRNLLNPDNQLSSDFMPWVAALGSSEDGRFHYRCVGLVISHNHILTDADCVSSANINVVQLNVTGEVPEPFAVENFVVGRRIHPRIRDREDLLSGNNIGLLELGFPLEFNDYVQPVCLPGILEDPDPLERTNSTIVGFEGIVDRPGGRSAMLYTWPNSKTLGYARCFTAIKAFNEEYPDEQTTLDTILTKKHICVDRPFTLVGKSAVLREDEKTGRVRVVGVAGVANAFKTNPIAYTLVQPHRFWIEVVLKKFRDNTST